METFEAFGEWGVDVFAVFGAPSPHPAVDLVGAVELADVALDGADGFLDVFLFEGVPVVAGFAEHHYPDFVDFPRFEALFEESGVPEVVAGGGEDGGEGGFAGGVVVGMADVSAGHEVAFGVGGDEDVGAVFCG